MYQDHQSWRYKHHVIYMGAICFYCLVFVHNCVFARFCRSGLLRRKHKFCVAHAKSTALISRLQVEGYVFELTKTLHKVFVYRAILKFLRKFVFLLTHVACLHIPDVPWREIWTLYLLLLVAGTVRTTEQKTCFSVSGCKKFYYWKFFAVALVI